MCGTKIRKADR